MLTSAGADGVETRPVPSSAVTITSQNPYDSPPTESVAADPICARRTVRGSNGSAQPEGASERRDTVASQRIAPGPQVSSLTAGRWMTALLPLEVTATG